jgi:hypothetical protein
MSLLRSWDWDGKAMSSTPWGGALGDGGEDVATPVVGLGRGGDVLIAVGRGFGAVAAPVEWR